MPSVEPLKPGDPTQIGAYRLHGRLGAGGMGQVFLGVSRGGRKVAVKVLRADLVTDAEFRARFAREVAAARTVNGFYTAPVVDADPDASPPWMVTAYVNGPSLDAAVAKRGPLSEPRCGTWQRHWPRDWPPFTRAAYCTGT
jgi:serine/threonine protein kinase